VLLGGETAEMPGFYDEGKYDIAGFSVGIVDRKNIIDGAKIREGDTLIGLASSGPHSNGFSLIRKVIPNLDEDFGGMPVGMALLEPTRLYVRPILGLLKELADAGSGIHGMAHITGGGFYENIPRMFCKNKDGKAAFDALIKRDSWTIPPIFSRIAAGITGAAAKTGAELLAHDEELRKTMFNTYNMGIGFVIALDPKDSTKAIEYLDDKGFPAWEIGSVVNGGGEVRGEVRFN
jgi:phosphoribosylformylglycinamidine cyclo-ligase